MMLISLTFIVSAIVVRAFDLPVSFRKAKSGKGPEIDIQNWAGTLNSAMKEELLVLLCTSSFSQLPG